MRENEKESKKATAADYGSRLSGLSEVAHLVGSCWKTLQLSLIEDLTSFSETFPRAGMMHNGIVYRLQPSAPLTAEIGSGLWSTPTANDSKNSTFPPSQKNRGSIIGQLMRRWPTPLAVNGETHKNDCSRFSCLDVAVRDGKIAQEAGGQLNPQWVEWLMGYPEGWTDLEA